MTPPHDAAAKVVKLFVPVVQRRHLSVEARLVPLVEPLFRVETHMSFEERMALFQAATRLPAGFVACEVGSYLGASAGFLGAAASLRNGHVHCVDTWQNDAMGVEPAEDTYAKFCQNTHRFRHFLTAHRGTAAGVADAVPDGLDLLFIDGDHSYEAVKADLRNYVPKLRPGGLLLMHDYHNTAGVRQAAEETLAGRGATDRGRMHSLQVFEIGVPSG